MRKYAVALTFLLVASGCGESSDTATPATTITPAATQAPTTTSVPTTPPPTTPATTPPPTTAATTATTVAPTTTTTANINWIPELLAPLVVSSASAPIDYDRDDWGSGWSDDDSDCINTRHEVLALESLLQAEMDPSGCKVVGGRWFAAFTGTYVDDPGSLDIDHFVPLANAHASGGWAWSSVEKRDYYNDLSDPLHLIAVTASANRSKGSKGPEDWPPPDSSYECQYAYSWAQIKARWGLTVTNNEMNALEVMLKDCNGRP